MMDKICLAGAGLRCVTDAIYTTSASGHDSTKIVGSLAEFEHSIFRERTHNSLEAARNQGRVGGKRPKLNANQRAKIVQLVNVGKNAQRLPHSGSPSHSQP